MSGAVRHVEDAYWLKDQTFEWVAAADGARCCPNCGRYTCGRLCAKRRENTPWTPMPYSVACGACGHAWRARRLDVAPHRGEDVIVPQGVVWAGCGCRALWMEAT